MMELEERYHWLSSREQYVSLQHEVALTLLFLILMWFKRTIKSLLSKEAACCGFSISIQQR